jgi:hypothetical protein
MEDPDWSCLSISGLKIVSSLIAVSAYKSAKFVITFTISKAMTLPMYPKYALLTHEEPMLACSCHCRRDSSASLQQDMIFFVPCETAGFGLLASVEDVPDSDFLVRFSTSIARTCSDFITIVLVAEIRSVPGNDSEIVDVDSGRDGVLRLLLVLELDAAGVFVVVEIVIDAVVLGFWVNSRFKVVMVWTSTTPVSIVSRIASISSLTLLHSIVTTVFRVDFLLILVCLLSGQYMEPILC